MVNNPAFQKIGLGTVQLGLDYGIANTSGKPNAIEAGEILNTAFELGIDLLDTACAYGDSQQVIGLNDPQRFKIVSKWNEHPGVQLENSLHEMNVQEIYGWMAHRAHDLINNPGYWEIMQDQKQNNKFQKSGYSLYSPEELESLLSLDFIPDIIQVPCNILDRRFIPYFADLAHMGCEIHCRSIYLQGLFFMDPDNLSDFFDPIKPWLKEFEEMIPGKVERISTILNWILNITSVSRMIIGIDHTKQLEELAKALAIQSNDLPDIPEVPEYILNPSLWPKSI